MTFGGHIVYLWPGKRHLRPDSTRHTNKLRYMPGKIHVIISIINTQGQIVQIYFIRKDCLT